MLRILGISVPQMVLNNNRYIRSSNPSVNADYCKDRSTQIRLDHICGLLRNRDDRRSLQKAETRVVGHRQLTAIFSVAAHTVWPPVMFGKTLASAILKPATP